LTTRRHVATFLGQGDLVAMQGLIHFPFSELLSLMLNLQLHLRAVDNYI
jgi:hypothetical protein